MKKNQIYIIKVDSNFDESLKRFHEQLSEDEEIVSQTMVNDKLLITTKRSIVDHKYPRKPKNLLLEEAQARNKKNG